MWRDKVRILRKLLRYRVVSGEVIPPDARVDPECFPESQFPLYCPECDYLLRGLPTERCPECGSPFDRGRLLVQQYVIERGKRLWKRTGKYAKWAGIIGFLLSFAPTLALFSLSLSLANAAALTALIDSLVKLVPFVLAFMLVGGDLLFVSGGLYLHLGTVAKKKYAQVFKGIDRNSLSFQVAQRCKWVLWVVWLGVVIVFLTFWAIRSSSVWYWYYAQAPYRMLIPVAGALGVGMLFYMGARLSKRWQDSQDNQDET